VARPRSDAETGTPPSAEAFDAAEIPTPLTMLYRDTLRTHAAARVAVERRTLTVISGPSAGQIFVLSNREHILGRGEVADLRVLDPDVSRTHARIVQTDRGRTEVQDLGSTNGTFVSGERISRAPLSPGARLQCGPNLLLRFSLTDDVEEELHRRMYESASRDVLTLAFNRRYFQDRLVAEVAHARRHHHAVALLKVSLDHFRRVNDDHGHAVGDVLLRALAARVSRTIRMEDVFARWQGDEFVILARSTALAEAGALAERVRASVSDVEIPEEGPPIRVSASIGVASLAELRPDAAAGDLMAAAERRLAAAKAGGRNRVVTEG
jgi:two-component system cell cycle response regulator